MANVHDMTDRAAKSNPNWLLIGVVCWTVFSLAVPPMVSAVYGAWWSSQQAHPASEEALGEVMMWSAIAGCYFSPPVAAVLAGPAWGALIYLSMRKSRVEANEERARGIEAAKRHHQTGESLRSVNLSRCDLTGTKLTNADLRGANLMSADLSAANLEGANLSRAKLDGANLQGAILRDATLDGAHLRRANLRDAKLQRAILWGANLYKADLRGANLQEANLLRAFLELARLDDSTVMPEGWRSSAGEELPDLAPKPKRFADFSPMPEEFADFARMLEEAKEKSGTLMCYECGHYNPIGQTNCEKCGAWVPQTAMARWAYGKDK
jgi:ribosomal protein L40E